MDYTKFKPAKDLRPADSTRAAAAEYEGFWWDADAEDVASAVVGTGRELVNGSSARRAVNLRHARLYENVEIQTLGGGDAARHLVMEALSSAGLISENVVASCIDTLAAKISKNRPRPLFMTVGGNWTQQRNVKKLDKWCRGVFYETKVYVNSQPVFVDAQVFGTGFLYVYLNPSTKRVSIERVMPDEVFVDDNDGIYGKPSVIFRRKLVHKTILAMAFPKKATEILTAEPSGDDVAPQSQLENHMCEVWEAWRLPCGGKGRHVVAIDGVVLEDNEWKLDRLPFVVLRGKPRVSGFWGKGMAEELVGMQVELNRTIRSISEQIRRKGKGRIFVQGNAKVEPASLTNGIGDIVRFQGNMAPIVDSSNAVSQDEIGHRATVKGAMYESAGISQLSAAAKKPSGLDAAVALREFSEIESERFALMHLAWEQFFLDFAELAIELVQAYGGNYRVVMPGRRTAQAVDFADIDLDRDAYVIQMHPVSSLPQTPSARFQRVQEWQQAGYISAAIARRLLEFPDLEAEEYLGNAAIDDVDATISKILDEETPVPQHVDPYHDVELLLERATSALLFARNNGCEQDRLDMLESLVDEASAKVAEMQMAAQPPAPMPGAPPDPAAPMPPDGGMAPPMM